MEFRHAGGVPLAFQSMATRTIRHASWRTVGAALCAMALVLGVLSLGSGAADATTTSVSDPLHDNPSGFDPRGDIVNLAVTFESSTITFDVTTAQFDDPASSGNWLSGASGISFNIDTTGDQTPEFFANYFNGGLGVHVSVFSAVDGVVCDGVPTWSASSSSYSFSVTPGCLNNPTTVAASAGFQYFDESWNGSFDTTDYTAGSELPSTTTTLTPSSTSTTQESPTTEPTTTTIPNTATTLPCKPGFGRGDDNHQHCDRSANTPKRSVAASS